MGLRNMLMINSRISYAALGLMHNLTPSSSGGIEIDLRHLPSKAIQPQTAVDEQPSHLSLRKGFGRIIRDEAGNVVDVEMADEEVDSVDAGPTAEAVDQQSEWTDISAESDWVKTLSDSRPGDDADAGVVPRELTWPDPR
jgi:nucleolar protein 16